jgi:hypothetical protein
MPVASLCYWRSGKGIRRGTGASPATASATASEMTRTQRKAVIMLSLPLFRRLRSYSRTSLHPDRSAGNPSPCQPALESRITPSALECLISKRRGPEVDEKV